MYSGQPQPAHVRVPLALLVAIMALGAGACQASPPEPPLVPTYDPGTGRLTQLASDRSGDGRTDTWAHMDGTRLERIDIDRSGDGIPDRFEYYTQSPDGQPWPERVEEANGSDDAITRREFYAQGALDRAEDDTNADGRVDKWEYYEQGRLVRVDLDLEGRGAATRRLHYDRDGQVHRVEVDPDGDGQFVPVP